MSVLTEIIEPAFTELGVKPPDQDLGNAEAVWGLNKLNRLLGQWATRRLFVYVENHNSYTFSASQQSYTIGPSGANFTATRPVRVLRANLRQVADSPDTHIPLEVINTSDYAALRVPALSSTIPTKLYYQPTFPNGTLWPWPYPTVTTNQLELFTWNQIASFAALSDAVSFPPGYLDALIYALAESMLPTYPSEAAASYVIEQARKAIYAIQSLNTQSPRLQSTGDGMPSGNGSQRSGFDYRTGDLL